MHEKPPVPAGGRAGLSGLPNAFHFSSVHLLQLSSNERFNQGRVRPFKFP